MKIRNKTNCPNCGAILPQFGGKCKYCGTRIVDLTMLDFDAQEPTMFLLNLPRSMTDGEKITISMWAHPELNSITMESSKVEINGGWGRPVVTMHTHPQVAFEMSLHPCADLRDNSLFKMETLCLNN
jgi:hypothetical protein